MTPIFFMYTRQKVSIDQSMKYFADDYSEFADSDFVLSSPLQFSLPPPAAGVVSAYLLAR
jgi:hypothetical protein